MTKTPLEEFMDAIYQDIFQAVAVPRVYLEPTTRADKIKHVWQLALAELTDEAVPKLLAAPDMLVLEVSDDLVGDIEFYKITYGEHSVVECEGVVVCRLT